MSAFSPAPDGLLPLSEAEAVELGSELETLSPNRLEAFASVALRSTDALRLSLGRFAHFLARAKRKRLAGRIVEATEYERDAERIYRKLPKGARW